MSSTTRVLLLFSLLLLFFSFLTALAIGSFSYYTLTRLYEPSSTDPSSSAPQSLPSASWMPLVYPWGTLFECSYTGQYPSLIKVSNATTLTTTGLYQIPSSAYREPACDLLTVSGRRLSDAQDINPNSYAFKSNLVYKLDFGTGITTVIECENGTFPSDGVRMECDVKAGRYMYWWCGGWAVAIGFVLVALA